VLAVHSLGDDLMLVSGLVTAYGGVIAALDRFHAWAARSLGAAMLIGLFTVMRLLIDRHYGWAGLYTGVLWFLAFIGGIALRVLQRINPPGPSPDYLTKIVGLGGILFIVGAALRYAG
jgi:hypothetical protein